MTPHRASRPLDEADLILRMAIVGLTLSTAYIHFTLGGLLFTLNATGYLLGGMAMIAPVAIASRFRWAVRIALAGYALTTIVAWAVQGPFYSTAYLAKGIEVSLIALLAIDFVRFDGNPVTFVGRELRAGFARLRGLSGLFGLLVLTVAVAAACSGSGASPTVAPSIDPAALTISADGLTFSVATLTSPADAPFQIVFDNKEAAPHNVAIYADESASAKVFVEEPFSGPRIAIYQVPALAAGTYFFRCDVHPDMKGTLTAG